MKINFSLTLFLPPTLPAWSNLKNFRKLRTSMMSGSSYRYSFLN